MEKSAKIALGCGITALVVGIIAAIVPFAGCRWLKNRADEAEAAEQLQQENKANTELSPVIERMNDGIQETKAASSSATAGTIVYDIDKTIRVIHAIDQALVKKESIRDYAMYLAKQDYRGVAPDVLEARKPIIETLLKLYAKQTEAEDQDYLWEVERRVLGSMLIWGPAAEVRKFGVGVEGFSPKLDFDGNISLAVNKDSVRQALDRALKEHEDRKELLADINELENELLAGVTDYAKVYYKYLAEWDRLCILRDHAYLAARSGDWDTAISSCKKAIRMAPDEREAHLLLAMAYIESGRMDDPEEGGAFRLLTKYVEDHPGSSAPAFLLFGNYYRKQGDTKKALTHYQQAAAYFPKQEEELGDMADPYRMRAFLRKTKEGNFIVEQYKSTMLGAGYFSPDLQMARMHFENKNAEAGRTKVMDHFSRRRNQQRWDYVISDIRFCYNIMADDFRKIFPEDHYVDLAYDTAFIQSSKLKVSVHNRSSRDLHNCTLILCLNMTDMYPDDYHAYKVGETLPLVAANKQTAFDSLKLDEEIFGEKTGDDVVAARGILITNEAVLWVDTDKYKVARIVDEARRRQGQKRKPPIPEDRLKALLNSAKVSIETAMGKDHVQIRLPVDIAALRPIFRFYMDDVEFTPEKNSIRDDSIELLFKNITNFEDKDKAFTQSEYKLKIRTWYADYALTWSVSDDAKFQLKQVQGP